MPDRGGVFHGCASNKTGALRVAKSASSCRRVKKRRGRIVNPGESAIRWNRTGRRGLQGTQGTPGQTGQNGATNVVVRTNVITAATGALNEADCNPGERAISGGVSRSDGSWVDGDVIGTSYPAAVQGGGTPAPAGSTPVAWRSEITLMSTAANITFYVVCASP
jgi:hypothetical protein